MRGAGEGIWLLRPLALALQKPISGLAQSRCKAPERPKPRSWASSLALGLLLGPGALGLAVVAAEGTRPRLSLESRSGRARAGAEELLSEVWAAARAVRAIVCQQNAREPTCGQGGQEPKQGRQRGRHDAVGF